MRSNNFQKTILVLAILASFDVQAVIPVSVDNPVLLNTQGTTLAPGESTGAYFPKTAQKIIDGTDDALKKRLREAISNQNMTVEDIITEQTKVLKLKMEASQKQTAELAKINQNMGNELARKQLKLKAVQDQQPTPLTCGGRALAVAGDAGAIGRAANAVSNADEAQRYQRSGRRAAGGAASAADVTRVHESFCDASTDASCKTKARDDGTNEHRPMLDADKKAESIIYGANNGGTEILTFTPSQSSAAKAYINNISMGAVAPRILSTDESNTAAGKMYNAKLIEYEASAAAARMPVEDILAAREPAEGSTEIAKALLDNSSGKSGVWLLGELNRIRQRTNQTGISDADLMRLEIGRRTNNAAWMQEIQSTMSPVALQRETLFSLNIIAKLLYQQNRREEMRALSQSVEASDRIKSRLLPQLQQLEKQVLTNSTN